MKMTIKKIFHIISYLQYPFLLIAIYFYIYFLISINQENINWIDLNKTLLFFGVSISFSTLQDTTKTQNKVSKKIWESPTKGKIFILILSILTILLITVGIKNYMTTTNNLFKEISFGLIVLGIGLLGLLKTAIEMFENHRLDKNKDKTTSNNAHKK